jgi:hypothetical protein
VGALSAPGPLIGTKSETHLEDLLFHPWDFAESVTTVETSGGYPGQIELVSQYLDHALQWLAIARLYLLKRISHFNTR